MKEFKFEYFLITLLVVIISAVMFTNPDLTESAKFALAAVTNLITGLAGFMFGIRNPNSDKQ